MCLWTDALAIDLHLGDDALIGVDDSDDDDDEVDDYDDDDQVANDCSDYERSDDDDDDDGDQMLNRDKWRRHVVDGLNVIVVRWRMWRSHFPTMPWRLCEVLDLHSP